MQRGDFIIAYRKETRRPGAEPTITASPQKKLVPGMSAKKRKPLARQRPTQQRHVSVSPNRGVSCERVDDAYEAGQRVRLVPSDALAPDEDIRHRGPLVHQRKLGVQRAHPVELDARVRGVLPYRHCCEVIHTSILILGLVCFLAH